MKEPMAKLRFGITSAVEVRILLHAWVRLIKMAQKEHKGSWQVVLLDMWRHVEIVMEPEEGPRQEIFLLFHGPLEMIEHFRHSILNEDMDLEWEFGMEELVITCRVIIPDVEI